MSSVQSVFYSMHCSSLWSQNKASKGQRLKVCYKTFFFSGNLSDFRLGSAHVINMQVQSRLVSFGELLWKQMYSLVCRIKGSSKPVIKSVLHSDVISRSRILFFHRRFLFVNPAGPIIGSQAFTGNIQYLVQIGW